MENQIFSATVVEVTRDREKKRLVKIRVNDCDTYDAHLRFENDELNLDDVCAVAIQLVTKAEDV